MYADDIIILSENINNLCQAINSIRFILYFLGMQLKNSKGEFLIVKGK